MTLTFVAQDPYLSQFKISLIRRPGPIIIEMYRVLFSKTVWQCFTICIYSELWPWTVTLTFVKHDPSSSQFKISLIRMHGSIIVEIYQVLFSNNVWQRFHVISRQKYIFLALSHKSSCSFLSRKSFFIIH